MIQDTRRQLQVKELESFLTEWVRRGKISGYVRYAHAVNKWLSQISDGRPLTTYTEDNDTDKASIRTLTELVISSHVDIAVLEQLRELYTEISSRYVDRFKRNSIFWDQLVRELTQNLSQYKAHSSIGSGSTTYIPFVSHPQLQLKNLTRSSTRGAYLPGVIDTIEQEPLNITLTSYPSHNPEGGVTVQNPEFVDSTQNIRKLFRGTGIEQWIWTTEIPHVVIDDITYPGIVWELELEYQGSITFSSILLNFRSKFNSTLCNIYTKNLDTDAWALVKRTDGRWDHVIGSELIEINDIDRTTARKIRIRLCQENYEIRNQDKSSYATDGNRREDLSWLEGTQSFNRDESNEYDDALTTIETKKENTIAPPGQFLYQIGLSGIRFSYDSYLANGNGDLWSHPNTENIGLKLQTEPIEIITIVPEQQTPEKSTVEWWVEDITRRFQIPILPKGTTTVREPVKFIDGFSLQLTFPIAADTVPDLYLNGTLQSVTFTEINSTEFAIEGIAIGTFDNYVIEYNLAIGQIVMGYVLVNDTTTTSTISGSNTDINTIYVNKKEADSWIVTNSLTNTMHSAGVMIRLDEYFYWFNNGEEANNIGRLGTRIPAVYTAPEL